MTDTTFPLAATAKSNIRSWKARSMAAQLATYAQDETVLDYIIDIVADTTIEQLDDETLERIVKASTAANLLSLGYPGARSNTGLGITPFFTVVLHAVKREFGDSAVYSSPYTTDGGHFRGIRNTPEVCKFYSDEIQRLIRRLLNQSIA